MLKQVCMLGSDVVICWTIKGVSDYLPAARWPVKAPPPRQAYTSFIMQALYSELNCLALKQQL